MSVANPIPKSIRRDDVAAAPGQIVYGPFDWAIYALGDLRVWMRADGEAAFLPVNDSAFTTLPTSTLPGFFTVTLDAAPSDGSTVRIEGSRLANRSTDVTRAGIVRSQPLERELDLITITLQEVRRDIAAAIAPDAAVAIAEAVVAAAAEQIAAIRDEAVAAAGEATDAVADVLAEVAIVEGQLVLAHQAVLDAQAANASAAAHDVSANAAKNAAQGYAGAAASYAAMLQNPDDGIFGDAVTESFDDGVF